MPRRGENIRKRKDGRWEGRYKPPDSFNGRSQYVSVYGKTYAEVKRKLREAVYASVPCESNFCDVTFRDAAALWQDANHFKHKASTKRKYEYLLQSHILPEFGESPVSAINAQQINTFTEKKLSGGSLNTSEGLSSAYVRTMLLLIGSVLRYAQEEWGIPACIAIQKPPLEHHRIDILNLDAQKKLERALMQELNPTNLGILISLYTGLRIGEVCALRWEDVDLLNRIIHIRHTVTRISSEPGDEHKTKLILESPKSKSSLRDIPIPTRILQTLEEMKKKAMSPYVTSHESSFTNPRSYEYRFQNLLRNAGIPTINYHVLRHTFATRCIEVGVDIKTLSEILGHSNVSITLSAYVHSSMELKRVQIEKLSGI